MFNPGPKPVQRGIHPMKPGRARYFRAQIIDRIRRSTAVQSAAVQRGLVARVDGILQLHTDLWCLGYRIEKVDNLVLRHLTALLAHWRDKGLARSTVAGRWSLLRTWCVTIGKAGMARPLKELWPTQACDAASARPRSKSTRALSDAQYKALLGALQQEGKHTLYFLARVVRELELTREEAVLLQPFVVPLSGGSEVMHLYKKKRGAAPRSVVLDTPEKRQLVRDVTEHIRERGRTRLGWSDLGVQQMTIRYSNAIRYLVAKLSKTGNSAADSGAGDAA